VTPPGLKRSLQVAGLEMEGTPHRALDDARNLARLTRILLDARAARRDRKRSARPLTPGSGATGQR
jgi:inhibitor of KinA sporulation pathway (predicted exonuclease)